MGDLYSLDPERAKNLMMLKELGNEVEDLGLSFCVDEEHGFGQVRRCSIDGGQVG